MRRRPQHRSTDSRTLRRILTTSTIGHRSEKIQEPFRVRDVCDCRSVGVGSQHQLEPRRSDPGPSESYQRGAAAVHATPSMPVCSTQTVSLSRARARLSQLSLYSSGAIKTQQSQNQTATARFLGAFELRDSDRIPTNPPEAAWQEQARGSWPSGTGPRKQALIPTSPGPRRATSPELQAE